MYLLCNTVLRTHDFEISLVYNVFSCNCSCHHVSFIHKGSLSLNFNSKIQKATKNKFFIIHLAAKPDVK